MAENELIPKDTEKYLTINNPRTARFYHLPKIHKPGNPGRPIISSCGAPTERISEYVNFHLQPLVRQIPSYLRDTKDFLQKITNLGLPPQECILLTLDVSSLYTNIPHEEGKQACKQTPGKQPAHILSYKNDRPNTDIEQFQIQWPELHTSPRDSNGNQNGTILCKHIHGGTGRESLTTNIKQTHHMVEIHR